MEDLHIKKVNYWCYNFSARRDLFPLSYLEREHCSYCHTSLDHIYSYIIKNLRESGILSSAYTPSCCYCQTLMKLGLIELRGRCGSISYSLLLDILYIQTIYEGYSVYFNIHDASKVLGDK